MRAGQVRQANATWQGLDGSRVGAACWLVASVRVPVRAVPDTDAPRSVVAVAEKIERIWLVSAPGGRGLSPASRRNVARPRWLPGCGRGRRPDSL